MKKVISILLIISCVISYYISYGEERNELTKRIQEIEMNLSNNYRIMIPINIDNNDSKQNYKNITKILDKYEGSIYYDRVSKDQSTRVKYIYDKNSMYTSKIELTDGKKLTPDIMETNKYLSTRKIIDNLQIGRIASFNKKENREIKTLKSMIDDDFNFSGPCYIAFKNSINIKDFINELEASLHTKGISIIDKASVNITVNNNYKIIVVVIYFIIMLLVLYELLNSYKKIGLKKMFGYSVKDIYLEKILSLIKINLGIGTIVTIVMSFIFFNQLNIYVYSFILKFIFYLVIETLALVGICSIAYIYIFFIKISNMLKNKKPLTGIIVLNYIAKIGCLILVMFFIIQAINNFKNMNNIFNKGYSNWEKLNDFAVIPESKIPISVLQDNDSYNVYSEIQKKLYKEFNEKGAIFADFRNYSPAMRNTVLSQHNYYYETDNVVVNPNYLNQYKIFDSGNNEITISDSDDTQILLVPDKYKNDESKILQQATSFKEQQYYSTGKNQKTRIIWTKSNQKVFTAAIDINPDNSNEIIDPIIYVLTENNASISDYDYLLGKFSNPFKIKVDKNMDMENTVRQMFKKYGIENYIGKISPVNEQVASVIKDAKDSIRNSIIFTILLTAVLIVIILQNSINYFDKYKQKLAIQKLTGYKIIDKHENYFIGIIISWLLVFSLSILVYKWSILNTGIICMILFIIEIVFSVIVLNVIEKKKIISIIKGE